MPGLLPSEVPCHPVRPERIANEAERQRDREEEGRSGTNRDPDGDVEGSIVCRCYYTAIEQKDRSLNTAAAAQCDDESYPCTLYSHSQPPSRNIATSLPTMAACRYTLG